MEAVEDKYLTLFDKVKIQSELLIPLLKDLRQELGEEKANEIVYRSLRNHLKNHYQILAETKSGSGQQKWAALTEDMLATIGDDVEVEHLRDDGEALDMDVVGCRYAQYFLGVCEPELGSILTCELDEHTVSASNDEVTLNRPKTIMKGDSKCEFRYEFPKNGNGV
ncbi:L-2-amino-thiazoline-4-carboxylic acid hydrolase [Pseudomonadota bacterium]